MPRKMTSAEARRMARARWDREREAVRAGLAASLDFEVLTGEQMKDLVARALCRGSEEVLREVGPSVVIAAAEMGVSRTEAERLGDLVVLLVAAAISNAGGPEVALPAPEAWRAEVAWEVIYDGDGRSRTAGEMGVGQPRRAVRRGPPRGAGCPRRP